MKQAIITISLALFAMVVASAQQVEWPNHGNDPGGSKYSSLEQINLSNVNRLERVWTWETGEAPIQAARVSETGKQVTPGKFQGSAVMVRGTVYISTSYSQVAAIDPETGAELWRYDPKAYEWGTPLRGCGFCHRGVAVWTDGDDIRVFINSRWRLIALDGRTGMPIESFGVRGEIDLTQDLVWEIDRLHYSNTSPPMIYKNIVIVGRSYLQKKPARRYPGIRCHQWRTRLEFSHDSAGRRVRQRYVGRRVMDLYRRQQRMGAIQHRCGAGACVFSGIDTEQRLLRRSSQR